MFSSVALLLVERSVTIAVVIPSVAPVSTFGGFPSSLGRCFGRSMAVAVLIPFVAEPVRLRQIAASLPFGRLLNLVGA